MMLDRIWVLRVQGDMNGWGARGVKRVQRSSEVAGQALFSVGGRCWAASNVMIPGSKHHTAPVHILLKAHVKQPRVAHTVLKCDLREWRR